eukprot:g17956.t1
MASAADPGPGPRASAVRTAITQFQGFTNPGPNAQRAPQFLHCLLSHSQVLSGLGMILEAVKKDLDSNIKKVTNSIEVIRADPASVAEVRRMINAEHEDDCYNSNESCDKSEADANRNRDITSKAEKAADGLSPTSTSATMLKASGVLPPAPPSVPSLRTILGFEAKARRDQNDGSATVGALWAARSLELALTLIGGCLARVQAAHPAVCDGLSLNAGAATSSTATAPPPRRLVTKAEALPLFKNLPISELGRTAYSKSALIKHHGTPLRMVVKMAMSGLPAGPKFFDRIDFVTLDELFTYIAEGKKLIEALPFKVYT